MTFLIGIAIATVMMGVLAIALLLAGSRLRDDEPDEPHIARGRPVW